ncbi:MAG: xanthine dehydrogenase accessory protein XdhC [Myxococcota bacterium]
MNVFAAAAEAWRSGQRAALATVISVAGSTPRSGGARMLVYADGTAVGTIGGGALEHRAVALALEVLATGRPDVLSVHLVRDLGMCCGGAVEVYVEPLAVREPMVVFGAGHVAHAVAPMLVALDYAVTVVDDRDELATEARFPGCTVAVTDPRAFAREMPDGPDRHWLVLTHDHALDQDLVETLLPRRCAWLGMIGSRGKVARFLVRLKAAGLDERLFTKLCAPVGLDLGAETPAEIAVAIAAELVRVRATSVGIPRRSRGTESTSIRQRMPGRSYGPARLRRIEQAAECLRPGGRPDAPGHRR